MTVDGENGIVTLESFKHAIKDVCPEFVFGRRIKIKEGKEYFVSFVSVAPDLVVEIGLLENLDLHNINAMEWEEQCSYLMGADRACLLFNDENGGVLKLDGRSHMFWVCPRSSLADYPVASQQQILELKKAALGATNEKGIVTAWGAGALSKLGLDVYVGRSPLFSDGCIDLTSFSGSSKDNELENQVLEHTFLQDATENNVVHLKRSHNDGVC